MVESTVDPKSFSISVKDTDGNDTGVYLYLDTVNKNGVARILEFFNITSETQINDNDPIIKMFTFDQRVINWALPQYYTKNGVQTEIGSIDSEGDRVITRSEVIDYITENPAEIAGYAIQTKIKFIG